MHGVASSNLFDAKLVFSRREDNKQNNDHKKKHWKHTYPEKFLSDSGEISKNDIPWEVARVDIWRNSSEKSSDAAGNAASGHFRDGRELATNTRRFAEPPPREK